MTISAPITVSVADRFVLQQTWWLVGELVRRHPDMWVKRYLHPEAGWLIVAHTPDNELQVIFDLQSGVQVHEQGLRHYIPWTFIFGQSDAHTALRAIENMTSLGIAHPAPSTAAKSLAFRLIAQLLTMNLDDRGSWDAIEVELDPILDGEEPASNQLIRPFRSVIRDVENQLHEIRERIGPQGRLRPYLWAITRDIEPLLVLDTDGFVHTRRRIYGTMEIYSGAQHDVSRAAAAVKQLVTQS